MSDLFGLPPDPLPGPGDLARGALHRWYDRRPGWVKVVIALALAAAGWVARRPS